MHNLTFCFSELHISLLYLLIDTLLGPIWNFVLTLPVVDHWILWLVELLSLLIIIMEYRKVRAPDSLWIYVFLCYLGLYHHWLALRELGLWPSDVRNLLWLRGLNWSFRNDSKLIERVSKAVAALRLKPRFVLLVLSLSHYRSCWHPRHHAFSKTISLLNWGQVLISLFLKVDRVLYDLIRSRPMFWTQLSWADLLFDVWDGSSR